MQEAVEITATPRRSMATAGDGAVERMCLAVEVKNVGEGGAGALSVLDAALLGRRWALAACVAAARDKNDTLAPREKTHLVLEATRIQHPLPDDKIEWSSLKIAKGSPDSAPNINESPYSKFVVEYKTSFVEDEEYFIRDNKPQSCGLVQSMFVVRWKLLDPARGKPVIGQHCLWLDCFNKATTGDRARDGINLPLDESDTKIDLTHEKHKNKKDNIVLFNLEHSTQINHNFEQNRLCMIPITINIINCYAVPVQAFIDMSKKRWVIL